MSKTKQIIGKILGISAVGTLVFAAIYSAMNPNPDEEKSSEVAVTEFLKETTRPLEKAENTERKPTRRPSKQADLGDLWGYNPVVFNPHNDPSGLDEFSFQNGDLFKRYSGENWNAGPGKPKEEREDNRVWVDAKIPIEFSSKVTLYGVSTIALGDVSAKTLDDYTENYGIGGGIGISYKISDYADLNFDFRHTQTIRSSESADDPNTNAAGFSLKLKF